MREKRNEIVAFLAFAYFLTRLIFLLRLPIFNDEAIYLDWGNRIVSGGVSLFYPLFDGKTPVLMWVFGVFGKIFSDPLFAGRLVSVITGAVLLLGIYKTADRLFGDKTAIVSSLFYIATPIFAFYDRQALMETSVGAIGVWMFYFLLVYLEKFKTRDAVICALSLSLGFYIKPSAALFLVPYLLIISVEFVKKPDKRVRIINGLIVFSLAVLLSVLPLFVQKNFPTIISRSNRYIGFPSLVGNFKNLSEILFWQLFPVTLVLSLLGIFKTRKNLFMLIWVGLPLAITVFASNSLSSRYVVSFLPLFSIFAAWGFVNVSKPIKPFAALTFGALFWLIANPFAYLSLLNKLTLTSDFNSYYLSQTAGEAIKKVRQRLEKFAESGPILVGVRLDAGNPESAMFAYYGKNKNDRIMAVYFDKKIIDTEGLDKISSPRPLYFVSRGENLAGMDKYLTEKERLYNKGDNFFGIYTLKEEFK